MKFNCVTVWHKNNDGGYERMIFDRATVSKYSFSDVFGSGITKKDSHTIRIFCGTTPDISIGDRICDGYEVSDYPPDKAYIIKEIKNNMNASKKLRHCRLECV